VPLLDFYRAYRALVRAKVLAFQLSERPELVPAARALFALAGRFAAPRKPARLLIPPGSWDPERVQWHGQWPRGSAPL
jgi:hypothetical protein